MRPRDAHCPATCQADRPSALRHPQRALTSLSAQDRSGDPRNLRGRGAGALESSDTGRVGAGGFISEVERSHLLGSVTRWVLNAALRQQRTWRDAGVDLTMAVNISTRSLRDVAGLPEAVAELTDLWDTPSGRLTLELTEGALIDAGAPDVSIVCTRWASGCRSTTSAPATRRSPT